ELLPERHICFGEHLDTRNAEVGPVPRRSWSVYIQGVSRRRCRLLLRGCIEPLRERTWRNRLASAMEPSLDFVMEQRMLRTVKRLAEVTVRESAAVADHHRANRVEVTSHPAD
ncbi:MAG: hypothetical protein KJO98_06255, partial [Rhodothermia bacterium]|nr:hypothetical protein [Rhodothermia bacterium]